MRSILLCALSFAACAGEAVDVTENGGNHLLGELVAEDATSVTVHGARGGTSWSRTLARDRIAAITYPAREYPQRAAAAVEPADEARLACWCLEEGLRDEAGAHARHALETDPEIDQARLVLARLGFVPDGKRWVTLDDWLAARQLAVIEGQVMTLADRDRVLAAQKRRDADRAAAAPATAAAKAADAAVAHDQARHDQLTAEKADAAKKLSAAQDAAKKGDDAKKKLAESEKQAQDQAAKRTRQGYGSTSSTSQQADQQAKKDAAATRDAASGAQRDVASLTKRQADLDRQAQAADAALAHDVEAQTKAKTDAEPAATAAAASEKALKDLLASIAPPPGLPPEVTAAIHAEH